MSAPWSVHKGCVVLVAFAVTIGGCSGGGSDGGGDPGETTGPPPIQSGKYVLWTRDSRILPLNATDMGTARSLGQVSSSMTGPPSCDAAGAATFPAPESGSSADVEVNGAQFGTAVYRINSATGCNPIEVVLSPAELRIAATGNGSGRVVSVSGAIDCTISGGTTSGACSVTRNLGTQFNLTASSSSGSTFTGYKNVCTTVGAGATCAVKTGQSSTTITVEFTQNTSTVINGSLTITPSNLEIAVTQGSNARQAVTVTQSNVAAALGAGRLVVDESFAPCSGAAATCVTLVSDGIDYVSATEARVWFRAVAGSSAATGIAITRTYPVRFIQPVDGKQYNITPTSVTISVRVNAVPPPLMYSITAQATGAQAGSIQSTSPDGQVRCFHDAGTGNSYDGLGGKCSVSYAAGTNVTLAAIPGSTASVFSGWGGACSGTSTTCTLILTGPVTVSASFSTASTGGGGGGGGGTSPPSFTTPDTYFADGGGTLATRKYALTEFTVTTITSFVFRFTSDYAAQAGIIAPSQANAFTSFAAFSAYAIFDSKIGTTSVTLGPGTYYLAVRNTANADNGWRYELDKAITLPGEKGYSFSFSGYDLQNATSVPARRAITQQFTIVDGYRYFIDGCNSGVEFYIMPASEATKFLNGQSFQYYTSYTSDSKADPGLVEIRLPAGTYAIGVRNQDSIPHSIVYTLERWRIVP